MISSEPETAIEYFAHAIEYVKETNITNVKIFIQDVVQGLVFYYKHSEKIDRRKRFSSKLFNKLGQNFAKEPDKIKSCFVEALKGITFKNEAINKNKNVCIDIMTNYELTSIMPKVSPLKRVHYHTAFFSRRWYSKIDQYPLDDTRLPDIEKYVKPRDQKGLGENKLKIRFKLLYTPTTRYDE